MLTELIVENLGVIDRAELSLDAGCVALTGETGAGKTLLVVALGLLLGERADRGTVRAGAGEARVEGRYVVPSDHAVVALLEANGVEPKGGVDAEAELVVTRTVPEEGRGGRARINGRLVTTALLAEAGNLLAEVAGQHEHQRIGAPAWQRGHLDAWAGPETVALAESVRDAVRRAHTWAARVDELHASARERSRTLDVLRYEITEIETAAVEPGESERLAADAHRLDHAESIAAGIAHAVAALTDEGGAHDLVSGAAAGIGSLAHDDGALGALAGRLSAAALEIEDVARELSGRSVTADPAELENIHQRLSVLGRLLRKYGADEAEVLRYLDDARARAAELDALEEGIDDARAQAEAERARAAELAGALSAVRREAAPRLARAVRARLETLALAGAALEVRLEPCELFEGGLESVEYVVSFNAGEPRRPIRKVASGGELARLALALNLAGAHGDVGTMVFDEVDAGVGGEAARSVGAALAELARSSGRQVMVVTHLPQVAAFADAQFRIEKLTVDGRSAAVVARVDGDERVAELSRMLAGMPGSDRARGHAEELLDHAAHVREEVSS
jgi:DNA repair protein RecN (Recombination protein N)